MEFLQGLCSSPNVRFRSPADTTMADYLPQAAYFYNTYYHPYRTYLAPIYRVIYTSQAYFFRYVFPTIYPLYKLSNNALQSLNSDAPDIFTLGMLAVVLIISIKVLDYMRKTVIYWISLAIRLGMWVTVLGIGVYVWQRGVEQSIVDFGWVWGLLEGLTEEGEKVGGVRAGARDREARKMASRGPRGRTRGGGW